jgi:serine phosphatase RsbU (regulator of sigma subunit)
MPTDPQQSTAAALVISDELRAKHPDLIALILESQSMNNEERQYWINILPIMTPEQLSNLRDILENEKRQLAAIDKKYSKEIQQIDAQQMVQKTEEERRLRRQDLHKQEGATQQTEQEKEQELLRKIQSL